MRPPASRSALGVVARTGNPLHCICKCRRRDLRIASYEQKAHHEILRSTLDSVGVQGVQLKDSRSAAVTAACVDYTLGGVGRAAPPDDEILVTAADPIVENSAIDPNVAASATQMRPSSSISQVTGEAAAITAQGRLFHRDKTGDMPVFDNGVSPIEQRFEILKTGVAGEVNAVELVHRAVRRWDELVVAEGALSCLTEMDESINLGYTCFQ